MSHRNNARVKRCDTVQLDLGVQSHSDWRKSGGNRWEDKRCDTVVYLSDSQLSCAETGRGESPACCLSAIGWCGTRGGGRALQPQLIPSTQSCQLAWCIAEDSTHAAWGLTVPRALGLQLSELRKR